MVHVVDVLAEEGRQDLHFGAIGSRGEVTRESGFFQSIDSSSALYLDENLLMPQGRGLLGQDGDLVGQDGGLVGLGNALVGHGGLVGGDLDSCDELPHGANINVMVHESGASLTEQVLLHSDATLLGLDILEEDAVEVLVSICLLF